MSRVEKQLRRKIDRHLENESRALQRVLFSLGKAREAREKLAEAGGSQPEPLFTLDDGTQVPFDEVEKAIRARVEDLMKQLGLGLHRLPW